MSQEIFDDKSYKKYVDLFAVISDAIFNYITKLSKSPHTPYPMPHTPYPIPHITIPLNFNPWLQ